MDRIPVHNHGPARIVGDDWDLGPHRVIGAIDLKTQRMTEKIMKQRAAEERRRQQELLGQTGGQGAGDSSGNADGGLNPAGLLSSVPSGPRPGESGFTETSTIPDTL
ncbi:hypothetical protein HK105_200876 [Polyrhizophydium stewartii]|uniref:Uncharacterized protein n=1 Tax=Polyrhizophydium stewartii TaxID=2732419 RepID=A0ABR4NI79_9FUNG|nr:hypothetical protein HK105_001007 [Polyrhizophydium stewartii]